jgi:hypothetical protein
MHSSYVKRSWSIFLIEYCSSVSQIWRLYVMYKMTVPGVYKPEKSDEAEVFLHSQMASQEHSDGNAPL